MLQTFIFSFWAAFCAAMWYEAPLGNALMVTTQLAAFNAILWHAAFAVRRRIRRCLACGSRDISEPTSDLHVCNTCSYFWRA